jgi:hypothetical protein
MSEIVGITATGMGKENVPLVEYVKTSSCF